MKYMIIPEKLKGPHINHDTDHLAGHLAASLRYMLRNWAGPNNSYACECKHCEITLYTNTKRLNCEYCGSSDPEVFTCTELKE